MEAIDLNIQQFHYMTSAERKAHNQLRQLVVENYVEKFHLQPISEEEHVVMSTSLDGTQLSFNRGPTNCVPFAETFAGTHQRGSYNQRQGNLHQNWLDKIKVDSQLKFCPSRSRTLQGKVMGFFISLIEATYVNYCIFFKTLSKNGYVVDISQKSTFRPAVLQVLLRRGNFSNCKIRQPPKMS